MSMLYTLKIYEIYMKTINLVNVYSTDYTILNAQYALNTIKVKFAQVYTALLLFETLHVCETIRHEIPKSIVLGVLSHGLGY